MYLATRPRRHRVARERAPGYDAGAPTTARALASAMAKLREARAALAAVDLDACNGDEIAEALSGLVAEESSIAVQEARLLREFERREVYRRDACVSTMGWMRLRTELSMRRRSGGCSGLGCSSACRCSPRPSRRVA